MRIIGIDPAIGSTGWGIIEIKNNIIYYIDSGIIKTAPSDEMSKRVANIGLFFDDLIARYRTDIASMEEIFVNTNPASSLKLAHARGAIMYIVGKYQIPLYEFAPNKIKKTLTGAGKADKNQILYMVNYLMPNANIKQLDEADALAAAYCGYVNVKFIK